MPKCTRTDGSIDPKNKRALLIRRMDKYYWTILDDFLCDNENWVVCHIRSQKRLDNKSTVYNTAYILSWAGFRLFGYLINC